MKTLLRLCASTAWALMMSATCLDLTNARRLLACCVWMITRKKRDPLTRHFSLRAGSAEL